MTGRGIDPTSYWLNTDLTTGDVAKIALMAKRGDPAWKIAARFHTSQRRIEDICRIEQVEVKA